MKDFNAGYEIGIKAANPGLQSNSFGFINYALSLNETGMAKAEEFQEEIRNGYQFSSESIILGAAKYENEVHKEHFIRLPLKTLNRHGLIAGATGTGKTKTLQIIAEQLSGRGIPSLVIDIKGDLSGIAVPSDGHPKIVQRHESIGLPFISGSSPVEFLSLSDEPGLCLRATVSEFGPILFSKMLGLNELQQGVVTVLYKYCDDHQLLLLDLKDFKKVLHYVQSDGKERFEEEYGLISSASAGAIIRRIIELEQQGGDSFFGEPSFDVYDLLRTDEEGRGVISILRVSDIQGKPKLFSTFMLQLLAEIYAQFPEEGDLDKPKLTLFIDEAHLVFEEATRALLDQMEMIIKLIRSKGVGIFFVTQNPTDIPDVVLSQLGLKVQHALRAFTAKDRKNIRLVAENFPITPFYDIDQLITELGIGEALVTALNKKGIPTPLVHCYLRAPQSRMDILTDAEISDLLGTSKLQVKYSEVLDRESAYELLNDKLKRAANDRHRDRMEEQKRQGKRVSTRRRQKSDLEKFLDSSTSRQIGRTLARELTRGLLGVLGLKK